jgi:hypothetical protein
MDAPSQISELYGPSLTVSTDTFTQQHPEGVHPSFGAPVSISIVCCATLLTQSMTATVFVAVSLNPH